MPLLQMNDPKVQEEISEKLRKLYEEASENFGMIFHYAALDGFAATQTRKKSLDVSELPAHRHEFPNFAQSPRTGMLISFADLFEDKSTAIEEHSEPELKSEL